ncbi:MAG TPA: hypothetical protein V6D06_08750 [Trichocoleus sp.]
MKDQRRRSPLPAETSGSVGETPVESVPEDAVEVGLGGAALGAAAVANSPESGLRDPPGCELEFADRGTAELLAPFDAAEFADAGSALAGADGATGALAAGSLALGAELDQSCGCCICTQVCWSSDPVAGR